MEKIQHRMVKVNNINMHIAETTGNNNIDGPNKKGTIIFLHGFPELWYSWRHQLISLSSAGYHAVAPDLRGYGETDAPPSATSYTALHVVGDIVALIENVLGVEKVFVVGHDWGAVMAWNLCLMRPDLVKGLVALSVPFSPRNPNLKPLQGLRLAFGDDFYICRFQEPGDIEEEFASIETAKVIKKFLTSHDPQPPYMPKGTFARAAEEPISLPPWLSEDDINYFADKFKHKGFIGGLNYYRAMDLTWELMAPWTGVPINVPVKFIMGDQDVTYNFPTTKTYLHQGGLKKFVPLLEDVVIMEGAGHYINQEKAEKISKHVREFFDKI